MVVCVDLGGSKVLMAVAMAEGQFLRRLKFPTQSEKGPEDILDRIAAGVQEMLKAGAETADRIVGIGVATPGPLSFPDTVVWDSPNLGWNRVNIKEEMKARLGWEPLVEKDTNMAVLGEYYFGQMQRCQNLLYITVSTGIGGGIMLGGQLYRGQNGGAGEIGHMVVASGGRICGCGRQGCLEAQASGTAIAQMAKELGQEGKGQGMFSGLGTVGAKEVGEAARRGDREARTIVAQVVDYLGIALGNLVNIFNPEKIVLGGAVSLGWEDLLLEPLRERVKAEVFPLNARDLQIEVTRLGEDVVLYGCIAEVGRRKTEGGKRKAEDGRSCIRVDSTNFF
ncbi:glucokinase / transcriptional regulator [Syntrophomonas wolfei subsp. wolfei str. Goettingen G311]|uniref:Glucokinase / transcriptional regulator n=1 Tax=Syntrophomonas wolfei subsp. wolfei (strain DSM 2245B / Goettingen) TaxID=335541 RepID=Q0B096_SYNWW|nr:glucokinase / transcriptional regulator [Syntrophomonas wolfei subsp. wolfei str. Goettingen G311]